MYKYELETGIWFCLRIGVENRLHYLMQTHLLWEWGGGSRSRWLGSGLNGFFAVTLSLAGGFRIVKVWGFTKVD